jgi:hypothetical protein
MTATNKIQLVNEYYSSAPFECHQDLDKKLSAHFDYIYDTTFYYHVTPRFFHQSGIKFTMRDYWWYIDQLYKSNPSSIVDLGCGECEWKRFFPNIIGVDCATNPWSFCDIVRRIDDNFFKENQNQYDCGINLHAFFGSSYNWTGLAAHIQAVMGVVKHSALFAMLLNPMLNIPTEFCHNYTLVVKAFIDLIYKLGYEVLLLDVPSFRTENPYPQNWIYPKVVLTPSYVNTIRFILKHPDSDYRKQA